MPRNDIVLFLDLETTGVDENLDNIIEVGIAVYKQWPDMTELFAKSYTVLPSDAAFERMRGKDVVREMHAKNGLLAEIEDIRTRAMNDEPFPFPFAFEVDRQIDEDLSQFGTRNSPHIPLAGSGVSHFDRKFVRKYLPLFDARITHWAYDVGVARRMFILAGAQYASDDAKTHRALDDARVHATEFKFYMDTIRDVVLTLQERGKSVPETISTAIGVDPSSTGASAYSVGSNFSHGRLPADRDIDAATRSILASHAAELQPRLDSDYLGPWREADALAKDDTEDDEITRTAYEEATWD